MHRSSLYRGPILTSRQVNEQRAGHIFASPEHCGELDSPTLDDTAYDHRTGQEENLHREITRLNAESSPLLLLSTEIRLRIWSLAFTGLEIQVRSPKYRKYVCLRSIRVQRVVALRQTCRQIRQEARSAFFRDVLFDFGEDGGIYHTDWNLDDETARSIRNIRLSSSWSCTMTMFAVTPSLRQIQGKPLLEIDPSPRARDLEHVHLVGMYMVRYIDMGLIEGLLMYNVGQLLGKKDLEIHLHPELERCDWRHWEDRFATEAMERDFWEGRRLLEEWKKANGLGG